jgi:hypothetical protein
MKRFVTLAICVVLLSGCAASGNMVKRDMRPEFQAKNDTATLVIIRDASLGFAVIFWNYLDGKLIGESTGRTYFFTDVKPGPHYVVVATENTAVARIDFEPGRVYFLREGVIMGFWRARTNGFEALSYDQAREAMASCTYLEFDPTRGGEDMDPKLYQQAIKDYQEEVKRNPEGFKAILEYKGYAPTS